MRAASPQPWTSGDTWAHEWAEGPYRYHLEPEAWDPSLPVLGVVGLNPSFASTTPTEKHPKPGPDPTMRRVMYFAKRDGFGGVLMANAWAFRSTKPGALRSVADPFGPKNHYALAGLSTRCKRIVVAWGAHPSLTEEHVARVLRFIDRPVYCFGTNADGSPKHPLYLRKDTPIVPWPVGIMAELAAMPRAT